MRLNFFVKLKHQSSTIILSVGIKYYMHDLLSDVSNMPDLQSSDICVSAPSSISSP